MSMSLAVGRKKRLISVISGIPVYKVLGAEETDEERRQREERERQAASGNGGGSETGSPGGNNGGEGGSGSGDGTSQDGNDVQKRRDSEDVETYKSRAAAADRAKGDIERKYNDLLNKEKSDLERANSKIEEQTQTIERVTRQRDDAIIQGELLKFPGYQWHDPDALLQLVDRNAIQIDEEGKVTGVKDAITKIAKDKPWMLKAQPGDANGGGGDQNKQQNKQTNGQQVASGSGGSNGGTPDDKSNRREELSKKYHLAGR